MQKTATVAKMSSTRADKNSKPHLLKLTKDHEKPINKPCIDFQPDDRWQIKEDGDEEEGSTNPLRRRSARKRKNTSRLIDSDNDSPIIINGESTKTELKLELEKEIKNGPLSKKAKTSNDKLESADETTTKNDSLDKNSNSVSDKSEEQSKTSAASSPESNVEDQLSAPVLEDERNKNEVKNNGLTVKVTSNEKSMPELTPNSCEADSKKDDNEISIIDEEKGSGDESDNDIQIIDCSQKESRQRNAAAEATLFQQQLDSDVLLSPGFPYYDALRKNIEFFPGQYKPVKFPHIGTLILEENEVIIESPSLLVPLLIKEADKFPSEEDNQAASNGSSVTSSKPKTGSGINFFQSTVGQFMINLGLSRVSEWYHKDMKKSKQKQLRKAGGSNEEIEKAIAMHDRRLKAIKESNLSFNFQLRKCNFCNFKTESLIVIEGHYLTPHLTSRREYRCNFCSHVCRDLRDMTFHFEAIHRKKLVSEDFNQIHECLFCSFSSNLKSKVTVHMNRCRKNFLPSQYQGLLDFEFPGITTKPVTIADVIAHRRMLMGSSKSNNETVSAFARKKLASVLSITGTESLPDSPTLIKHLMGPHSKQTVSGFQLPPGIVLTRPRVRGQTARQSGTTLQPQIPGLRPSAPRASFPSGLPTSATHLASSGISITPINKDRSATRISVGNDKNITLTPISSTGNQVVSQKPGPPQPVALFTNMAGSDITRPGLVSGAQSSRPVASSGRNPRLMPPYQRLNTPPSQVVKNSSGNTFVLCEICDSYIKDLEELRSHMNWVHKVKIHPKMLVSRPPLNCQKCQWRFFTDQGLERHLLGAHGLVTTNMQEMANKNQDGGRCIICGAVFTYKLVSHMTQVHKVTLKPAHLSYKCTVCTATFTLYRLFESHVYNVHSASAKRPAEESVSEPPAKKAAPAEVKKDIKKEEVTPAVAPAVAKTPSQPSPVKCPHCSVTTDDLLHHLKEKHIMKCYVKLCRIEKCEKCLYSSGEMLVMHLSDFENDSESDEDSSSDEDNENGSNASKSPEPQEMADESKL